MRERSQYANSLFSNKLKILRVCYFFGEFRGSISGKTGSKADLKPKCVKKLSVSRMISGVLAGLYLYISSTGVGDL